MTEMDAIKVSYGENAAAMKWRIVGAPRSGRRKNREGPEPVRSGCAHPNNGFRVFDLNFEFEAVVSKLNVWIAKRAEAFVGLRVRKFVGDVREPGAARLKAVDKEERLLDSLVHRMRRVAQGVDDEFVETLQEGDRGFGDRAEIGQISGVAETKT